jgi:tRNA-dependent cyclodipeptide synthase
VENSHELLCLISIGSTSFNKELIQRFNRWAQNYDYIIRYVILSEPERHNIQAFESLSDAESAVLARKRAIECQRQLGLSDAAMLSWEKVCPRIGFEEAYEKIRDCYATNKSFQRHCLSQTFSNLQPRFLQHGVKKKSDALVRKTVSYLLEELALKIGAFETGEFAGEVLPHREMDVTNEIYSGTYFNCPVSRKGFQVFSMTPEGMSQVKYSQSGADSTGPVGDER